MLNSFCVGCYLSATNIPTVDPRKLVLRKGPQSNSELPQNNGLQGNAELPAWFESSVDTRWIHLHNDIPVDASGGRSNVFGTERVVWVASPSASPSPPPSTIFSSINSTNTSGSTISSSLDSIVTSKPNGNCQDSNHPYIVTMDVAENESCGDTMFHQWKMFGDENSFAFFPEIDRDLSLNQRVSKLTGKNFNKNMRKSTRLTNFEHIWKFMELLENITDLRARESQIRTPIK